jgi:uncharacterized protein (DUF58 family)
LPAPRQVELKHWHDWTDPNFFDEGRQSEWRFVPLFLRQLVPTRVHRTKLTVIGWMLIIVALGIGSAAYNTGSNILFMTLSLLLSSLVLSGILSLINFKKLEWTLKTPAHLQVGEVGLVEIDLTNRKSVFPSMSLCFRLGSSDEEKSRGLYLQNALGAKESTRVEWTFTPLKRGACRIYLEGVESKFPFGFLYKFFGDSQEEKVLVWPSRIDYRFAPQVQGRRFLSGVSRRVSGLGSDLLNIREYRPGDPPKWIHWKASARLNKLMIRQLAQEGEGGFHLEIDPDRDLWSGAQFEALCSLACSLAEDLFHAGRLQTVHIIGRDTVAVRSMRELHDVFDALAELRPSLRTGTKKSYPVGRKNRVSFRPMSNHQVAIYVDDLQAGQTDD